MPAPARRSDTGRPIGAATACSANLAKPQVRHDQVKAPIERMPPEIPRSQFARIRTWVKYGITAAQVAGVYGVAVDVIERILRQA